MNHTRPWFATFSTKKPGLPSKLKERRFNEAESRWQKSFEEVGFEQQQQFFNEDQTQWEGENARVTEFEDLMAMLGDAFLRNEKRREIALQNWNTEKEGIYERSEASRETIFKITEDRRESLFQKDHDRHLERSEWYNDVRLQHIQRGHHNREQAFQQLEQEMMNQFETTSCFLRDALATSDHRHASDPLVEISASQSLTSGEISTPLDNPIGNNNVDAQNGVVSVVNHDSVVSLDQLYALRVGSNKHSPPNYVVMTGHSNRPLSSLELYPSRSPTVQTVHDLPQVSEWRNTTRGPYPRSRSRDSNSSTRSRHCPPPDSRGRSYTPQQGHPSVIPPIILPQPTIIIRRSRSPSPVYFTDGKRVDFSQRMTPPLQDPVPESSLGLGDDIYSARFFREQHLQEHYFSTQEDNRTRCFESAEAERDRAGALRTNTFKLAEQRRSQQFEEALRACEDSLRQREMSRLWRENMRRQQFSASQTRRSIMFDEHMTWITKKDSAMHTAEGYWIFASKQRLETLSTLHNAVLKQYRWALARNQSSERSPSPSPLPGSSISEGSDMAPFIPPSPVGTSRSSSRNHRHRRSRSRSQSRSRVRPRSRSPRLAPVPVIHSAGFAPQILTTKDLGTHLPLPSSSGHSHAKKKSSGKAADDWTSAQRRRQFLFEESQEDRSRRFEHGMRSRRSQFEASENRRQREFKEAQRSMKASSAEAERNRDIGFQHFQVRLNAIFDRGEEERERVFQKAEMERQQMFQRGQSERRGSFYQAQEDLQRKSFNQENSRASAFNIWWGEKMASVKTMVLHEKMGYFPKEEHHDQKIVGVGLMKGRVKP